MRPLVLILLTGCGVTLSAGVFDIIKLGYLIDELLPIILGLLIFVWLRMSDDPPSALPCTLQAALWQGIVTRMDDRPKIRLDVKEGFFSRSHIK